MSSTAKKTDPKLWEQVKREVTDGDKGGEPGQWSARKAQYAVQEYKKRGGGYEGKKTADNHLREWTREDWDTKSGKPSGETGERCPRRLASQSATTNTPERRKRNEPIAVAGSNTPASQPMWRARPAAGTSPHLAG